VCYLNPCATLAFVAARQRRVPLDQRILWRRAPGLRAAGHGPLQVLWLNNGQLADHVRTTGPFEPKPTGLMFSLPVRQPGRCLPPRTDPAVRWCPCFNWWLVFSVFFGGKAHRAIWDLARTNWPFQSPVASRWSTWSRHQALWWGGALPFWRWRLARRILSQDPRPCCWGYSVWFAAQYLV